jgi:hypothetical protein
MTKNVLNFIFMARCATSLDMTAVACLTLWHSLSIYGGCQIDLIVRIVCIYSHLYFSFLFVLLRKDLSDRLVSSLADLARRPSLLNFRILLPVSLISLIYNFANLELCLILSRVK